MKHTRRWSEAAYADAERCAHNYSWFSDTPQVRNEVRAMVARHIEITTRPLDKAEYVGMILSVAFRHDRECEDELRQMRRRRLRARARRRAAKKGKR